MPAPTSVSPEEREFAVDSRASMHMVSKRDLSSDEFDTLRRSRNTHCGAYSQWVKCIQTRKHKFSFTTSISSWQCNYSKKRLLFSRLENSAKTTDIPMTRVDQRGEDSFMRNGQLRTSCCSRVIHQVLVAIRRQHRHRRICLQQVQPKNVVTD